MNTMMPSSAMEAVKGDRWKYEYIGRITAEFGEEWFHKMLEFEEIPDEGRFDRILRWIDEHIVILDVSKWTAEQRVLFELTWG